MLLSHLECGLNHLPSGGKIVFNDKKFEFQISSEKESVRHRGFSPNWTAGQRCLLANPGGFSTRLWVCTQTWSGFSPAPDAVGFYSNVLSLINICQTFCRDGASHVSHFRIHMTDRGCGPQLANTRYPSEADDSVISYLHWLRCAWVHRWAEAL